MSNSPNLSLPFIQPSQAQKHITHNLAIELLDALVHMRLSELAAPIPPDAPAEGQVLGVARGATGAFKGQDGKLACYGNGSWMFVTPQNGFTAWVEALGAFHVYRDGEWRMLMAVGMDRLDGLGINTSWDEVNRFAVASESTLLSHAGGGHQLKINKAASAESASLLFQNGFSGRAEIGLAGSDTLSMKVSADGTAWSRALEIDAVSGDVEIGSLRASAVGGDAVQAAPTDTTPGRLMRADWGYGPGNLLGPVTVADGVPSGAVIESSQTENGRYTKWADGTQICEAETDVLTTSETVGACYRSALTEISWPAAFSDIPAVSGSCNYVGGGSSMWVSTTSPNATKCSVRLMSATISSRGRIRLVGYGRWN